MKRPSRQTEKWLIGILGVVCLALVVFLARRILGGAPLGVPAGTTAGNSSASGSKAAAPGSNTNDLARYNPSLNLERLKEIEDHPLPDSSRNPFEYPPPPKPPVTASGPAQPPPPPPPPPLPLKAIGYSVKAGNIPEAVVADDQDIYVVHAGETFAKRYHVVSLTPNNVEIHDATTQQTVQLPIAQ